LIETKLNKYKPGLLEALDIVKEFRSRGTLLRELYRHHFPELDKIVSDPVLYARIVNIIQNKSNLTDMAINSLEILLFDHTITATNIREAARTSIGTNIEDKEFRMALLLAKAMGYADKEYKHTMNILIQFPSFVFNTTCCPQCKSQMTLQRKWKIKPIFDTLFIQLHLQTGIKYPAFTL
jgi:hypothetical protein